MSEQPAPAIDLLSNPNQLCFTGFFLLPKEREELLELLPAAFDNIDADHITQGYYGRDPNPPATDTLPVGETFKVRVLGHVIDNARKVQAAIVDIEIPGEAYPHITISTGNNDDGSRVPPFLSNEAIEYAIQDGTVMPVPEGTFINMVSGYCLGDYDNSQGTIVTSL